jgi:hypothetical protein
MLQLIPRHSSFISEKFRIPIVLRNKKKGINNAEVVIPAGLQARFRSSYSFA